MNQQEMQALSDRVRRHCVRMTFRAQSGHIGSMLSMADILTVMYCKILNISPPQCASGDRERDRFILSKGHGGGALYALLAELGYFPQEWLDRYYLDGGHLGGHISHYIPGVEFSTGSLGHGLPVATGMAMAAKKAGERHRIFCLVSDGDCNAGSSWEAIMLAGQHRFDNLVMVIDYNRLQALGKSENIINLEPFDEKLRLFNWYVETVDGHDMEAIEAAFRRLDLITDRPKALLFRTVKGKGVSFMENNYKWHYGGMNELQLEQALAELGGVQ